MGRSELFLVSILWNILLCFYDEKIIYVVHLTHQVCFCFVLAPHFTNKKITMSIWYKIYIYTIKPSLPDLINWNVVNYPLGELCPSHHSWLNYSQKKIHRDKLITSLWKKYPKSFPHCQCCSKSRPSKMDVAPCIT